MKKTVIICTALVIVALALVAWTGEPNSQTPRSVTVSGAAEVRVVPDQVLLTLGVETRHPDLETAKVQNDERVAQVLAVVQEQGILPKHIQTDHISIEPLYHDSYAKRELDEYVVRKTIALTLHDLTRFDDLLTGVLRSGANYVYDIQFRTTDLRQHKDTARALAVEAAQEKATALAKELGQAVGEPLLIREEQSAWQSWYSPWSSMRGGMAQNVVQNMGGGSFENEDSTIAPGQISVTARVSVSFELR